MHSTFKAVRRTRIYVNGRRQDENITTVDLESKSLILIHVMFVFSIIWKTQFINNFYYQIIAKPVTLGLVDFTMAAYEETTHFEDIGRFKMH